MTSFYTTFMKEWIIGLKCFNCVSDSKSKRKIIIKSRQVFIADKQQKTCNTV